jgi:hypothetical protein
LNTPTANITGLSGLTAQELEQLCFDDMKPFMAHARSVAHWNEEERLGLSEGECKTVENILVAFAELDVQPLVFVAECGPFGDLVFERGLFRKHCCAIAATPQFSAEKLKSALAQYKKISAIAATPSLSTSWDFMVLKGLTPDVNSRFDEWVDVLDQGREPRQYKIEIEKPTQEVSIERLHSWSLLESALLRARHEAMRGLMDAIECHLKKGGGGEVAR